MPAGGSGADRRERCGFGHGRERLGDEAETEGSGKYELLGHAPYAGLLPGGPERDSHRHESPGDRLLFIGLVLSKLETGVSSLLSTARSFRSEGSIKMSKIQIWQLIPYLLPVISYVIGKSKNRLAVPKPVRRLLEDQDAIEIIVQGIEAADAMSGKTDEEKREYVRAWAKSELYRLLGEWLPDSAVNFLIEHTIVQRKDR